MCVYSMVIDQGKQFAEQFPVQTWSIITIQQYLDLLKKVEEIDAKLGMKDCADPEKAKFMEQVLARLDALEKEMKARKKPVKKKNTKKSTKKTKR